MVVSAFLVSIKSIRISHHDMWQRFLLLALEHVFPVPKSVSKGFSTGRTLFALHDFPAVQHGRSYRPEWQSPTMRFEVVNPRDQARIACLFCKS